MNFSLEMLRARHGDCLLLHYGTASEPATVLIDGGPGAVYGDALKPRLEQLRQNLVELGQLTADQPLPLDLIMVSHIDDDHIGGLLGLTGDLIENQDRQRPQWLRPKALWHNAFGDLVEDTDGALEVSLASPPATTADALIASVPQGRTLQAQAERLGWAINAPFTGLVQAPETGGQVVDLDDATSLLVLAPRANEIEGLRKEWAEQMRRVRSGAAGPAELADYLDESPFNLSSIVCLARQGERRMLLTGDARGDHMLEALDAAGITNGGVLHVDVLKLPHHGSIRNVKDEFFERISADHYVISANGRDGNPETETLELIAGSRTDDDFTIHLTYAQGLGDLGVRLQRFVADQTAAGRGFDVRTRDDTALSLTVDLGAS